MKVTIDTANKTFEVCTKEELLDFNNLIIELQKTIERCRNTITIANNTSTTGIPCPTNTTVDYNKTAEFFKTHSVRTNF